MYLKLTVLVFVFLSQDQNFRVLSSTAGHVQGEDHHTASRAAHCITERDISKHELEFKVSPKLSDHCTASDRCTDKSCIPRFLRFALQDQSSVILVLQSTKKVAQQGKRKDESHVYYADTVRLK